MHKTTEVYTALEKAAEYVAITQPQLDKVAADESNWAKKAHATAAVLANRGFLNTASVDDFVEKVATDKTYALHFLEKLASAASVASMGSASVITKRAHDDSDMDPFVKELMPETIQTTMSGMVD